MELIEIRLIFKFISIMKTNLFFATLFAIALLFISCKDDCFDRELKRNSSGPCSTTCDNVCGCDGITYCTECDANIEGIRVISQSPCNF